MDIIVFILTLVSGVVIGLIIGLVLVLKQNSDDITKFDIELAKIQSELDVLKELDNGNDY